MKQLERKKELPDWSLRLLLHSPSLVTDKPGQLPAVIRNLIDEQNSVVTCKLIALIYILKRRKSVKK